MLSMSNGEGHAGTALQHSQAGGYDLLFIAIPFTKEFPFFLVRFGSGCHLSLQTVGGCATSRTVAETHSRRFALPPEGLKTINPDIGATQSVQATFCQRRKFLVKSSQ